MPQLKKLSQNNILPKMNLKLNQSFSCGNESVYSPSYLALLIEEEKYQHLTSEPESDVSDSVQNRPRKRQRLDHLSQEEKIMRRKLKNRVAAQTARDRKKAKMQELEDQVSFLLAEKRLLLLKSVENMKRIQILEQENTELKIRLGLTNTLESDQKDKVKCEIEDEPSRVSVESRSVEQASLINVTQLKGQDLQILSLWMMRFVYLPAITRLLTFWIYYGSVGKILWNVTSMTPAVTMTTQEKNSSHTALKWWGPHQKAWNPTKN